MYITPCILCPYFIHPWWEGLSETLKIFYKSLTLIKKEVLLKNEPIKTANAKMSSNTYQVPIAPPTRGRGWGGAKKNNNFPFIPNCC